MQYQQNSSDTKNYHFSHQGNTDLMNLVIEEVKLNKIQEYVSNNKDQLNKQNDNGETALFLVCVHHSSDNYKEKIIQMLINVGADVNIQNKKGFSPLMICCTHENNIYEVKNIVTMLINANADLNLQDWRKKTALMHCITNEFCDIAELLINCGANLDLQDNFGNTALRYAIHHRDYEIIEKLLSSGANVHIKCSEEDTALSYYCRHRVYSKDNTLKMLIDAYKDLSVVVKGKTYFEWICSSNYNVEIVKYCFDTYPNYTEEILMSCLKIDHPRYKELLLSYLDKLYCKKLGYDKEVLKKLIC